jgi:hypothetical protein
VSTDDPAAEVQPPPRRYPSTIGGALYLVALLGVGVGMIIVMLAEWRLGIRWVGGSLLFAAGCRLLVPRQHAGMLAVRHRLADTTLLGVVGGVLIVLAGSIPNQPL